MDFRITNAARLQQQKNYPAAEQIYRQILTDQPNHPDVLLLFGLLLHETGRNEMAAQTLHRAIAAKPGRAEVHQTLVSVLGAMGRLTDAIVQAREIVRLRPTAGEAHHALAYLLTQSADYHAALPHARRAIELSPRSAPFLLTLSRVYLGLESQANAMAALDQALAIDPKFADAMIDKAQLLQAAGRIYEAIMLYEAGLKLSPNSVAAHNNLGGCYLLKLRAHEAIVAFEAAATLWPLSPKPRNNVGVCLKEMGQIDEAIVQFQKSVQLDPTYADAYCNIGSAYASVAENHRAIEAFRQTLNVKPDFAAVGSNLLMCTLSPPDISREQVLTEHVDWARRHALPLRNQLVRWNNDRSPHRRLKIAYISPDFREHSVRYFIEPILRMHDKASFEVHCYAAGRRRDEVSDHLAGLTDAWHPIADLSDRQLAETIRADQIDILIDLAGHTSDNRLMAFALKPAPVQVTYLGYPMTTGLGTIDYRLTDNICDPPGSDAFYTEKLVRLPNAFFVYGDNPSKPFNPILPADRNGYFTFGSFNSYTKFNDQTLSSWANILRQVPNSRMLIKAKPIDNPSTRAKLLNFFTSQGIAIDRLDLRSWVTLPEHFQLLSSTIDLMLDTFPYNGHTTSCQALWMGVPIVTRSGDTFRSSVGRTILHNLAMDDFVAESGEQYEQIAIAKATDLDRLRAARPTLRDRLAGSPLCDATTFTRNLEYAYRQMWHTYCQAV
jgi:protein O-GlcNAc transferase